MGFLEDSHLRAWHQVDFHFRADQLSPEWLGITELIVVALKVGNLPVVGSGHVPGSRGAVSLFDS